MTNVKFEKDKKIKCKVEISFSKSYLSKSNTWKKDKLKSKTFKYKINAVGYSKKSLEIMGKEILAWSVENLKKARY